MTFMEALKQFNIEYPNMRIGKTEYATSSPQNVLSLSDEDQNVCCCQYHENFDGNSRWACSPRRI